VVNVDDENKDKNKGEDIFEEGTKGISAGPDASVDKSPFKLATEKDFDFTFSRDASPDYLGSGRQGM
jgi:hypothetical protein